MFRGIANPPDQSTESTLRLSFTNTPELAAGILAGDPHSKACPWNFPTTAAQRQEAVSGGTQGAVFAVLSMRIFAGPDRRSGEHERQARPITTCDYSRAQCQQRGMFDTDNQSNVTRRFGGIEFVPACDHGAKLR